MLTKETLNILKAIQDLITRSQYTAMYGVPRTLKNVTIVD